MLELLLYVVVFCIFGFSGLLILLGLMTVYSFLTFHK